MSINTLNNLKMNKNASQTSLRTDMESYYVSQVDDEFKKIMLKY